MFFIIFALLLFSLIVFQNLFISKGITTYEYLKEYYKTVLHEIHHALMTKQLGAKKFMKKYTQAGTIAAYVGLDPHNDNKWEIKAEDFAKRELKKIDF